MKPIIVVPAGATGFETGAGACTLCQLLAALVGAFKPTEIGALAGAGAGHKERHVGRLRRLLRINARAHAEADERDRAE